MDKMKYVLSIVIPTKNRQWYAMQAVKEIVKIQDGRVQVVIHDNSDTNSLQDMLINEINDKRVKYKYTFGDLSFVDNFNQALEISDGYYVCFIGDDDSINPAILSVSLWAMEHNIDAILPSTNLFYIWPESGIYNFNKGYLCIEKKNMTAHFCNPQKSIKKLLNNGCQKYLELDLVKSYHGIVKKECFEKIKMLSGKYFGGLSPDINSSIALSAVVDTLIKIQYPLTIPGVCKKSGSADSATGKHVGELSDAPHLRGHFKYSWSDMVTPIYSVETIWADSALAALKDLNMSYLFKEFNYGILTAYCFVRYGTFRKKILMHYNKVKSTDKSYDFCRKSLTWGILTGPVLDFLIRGYRKMTRRNNNIKKFYDVPNIEQAQKLLIESLQEWNLNEKVLLNELNKCYSNYRRK